MAAPAESDRIPAGTVEAWALRLVQADRLEGKTRPAEVPDRWAAPGPAPVRLPEPGRPPELRVAAATRRSIRPGELRQASRRAELLHRFWHHELQAAELMAWALLAFPDTPEAFRHGLLSICQDELRHMRLYQGHIERLGHRVGDFPVRDWFWQRVSACRTPLQFVSLLGVGFEGGNLDHAERFRQVFLEIGDERAAAIQETVEREEREHVRFALHWFAEWTGGLEYSEWERQLAATGPLTPSMLRGNALHRAGRIAGGFPEPFLAALDRCKG